MELFLKILLFCQKTFVIIFADKTFEDHLLLTEKKF